ncbi:MAG: hypothetical protein KIS61_30095 [Candidatus Eremiobacteraeota bacterium]|nr:hypothetical protein [Candidatus Eremiobacteraeota bacterium]
MLLQTCPRLLGGAMDPAFIELVQSGMLVGYVYSGQFLGVHGQLCLLAKSIPISSLLATVASASGCLWDPGVLEACELRRWVLVNALSEERRLIGEAREILASFKAAAGQLFSPVSKLTLTCETLAFAAALDGPGAFLSAELRRTIADLAYTSPLAGQVLRALQHDGHDVGEVMSSLQAGEIRIGPAPTGPGRASRLPSLDELDLHERLCFPPLVQALIDLECLEAA